MILLLLLSLAVPVVIGWFLISLFARDAADQPPFLLRACLSAGLGLGVCSVVFFLWMVAFRSSDYFVSAELVIGLCLSAVLVYKTKWQERGFSARVQQLSISRARPNNVLRIAFSLALLAGAAGFALLSLKSPHGGYDGWAIWTRKARFMFRGGAYWTDAFTPLHADRHPDYPLLIPATIARYWKYLGHETVLVPALVAMFFTFGTVGLTVSSLSALRSRSQGLLGGLLLLGTPFFVMHGATQYADVPLGFFILVTFVLFALYGRANGNSGLLVLAGLSTGFAAWTKNEGLLFMVAVVAVRFGIALLWENWKNYAREMLAFGSGLLPVLFVIIFFKIRLAPPSDLLAAQGVRPTFDRLLDISRYIQTAEMFLKAILPVGFGGWFVNVLPLLPFYLLLLGSGGEQKDKTSITTAVSTLCLVAVGYFLAYITTPRDLVWHLYSSLDRLLLQLWPSSIFTFFLLASTPEQSAQGMAEIWG